MMVEYHLNRPIVIVSPGNFCDTIDFRSSPSCIIWPKQSIQLLGIALPTQAFSATPGIRSFEMLETGSPQRAHMKADGIALASRWYLEGKTPGQISLLLRRDVKTIKKHITKKKDSAKVMKVGCPKMPEATYTKCNRALVTLQKQARRESPWSS